MKVDYDGSVIRKHDSGDDVPHAEKYPMPTWLDSWFGRGQRGAMRMLIAADFPVDNYRAVMVKAVDGDTIECDLVLRRGDPRGLGKMPVRERIRLLGFNSPELNQEGGHEARRALDAMLPAGTLIYLHLYEERRSFNRLLAWAYADSSGSQLLDIGAAMISGGYGVAA